MAEQTSAAPVWRSSFQGEMWDVIVGDGHAVVYDDARGRDWTLAIFAGGRPVIEERDVRPRAAAM